MRGKKLRCKQCQGIFMIQPAEKEDNHQSEQRVATAPVASRRPKPARDDDEHEDRPRKPSRARREDDEEGPRKAARQKSGSWLPLILVLGGGCAVLALLVMGLAMGSALIAV